MCYNITINRACIHSTSYTQQCRGQLRGGSCSIPEHDVDIGVDFTCVNCIYNREYWSELEATVESLPGFVSLAENISNRYHEHLYLFWEILELSSTDREFMTVFSMADLHWLTTARKCVDISIRDLLERTFTVLDSEEVFANYRSQFLRLMDTLRFMNEVVERGICMKTISQSMTDYTRQLQARLRALHGGQSLRPLVRDILPENLPADFTGCPICEESENLVHIACPSNHVFCRGCVEEWVKDKEIATCPLDRWSFRRSEFAFPGDAFMEDESDDDGHLLTPRWLLILQGDYAWQR